MDLIKTPLDRGGEKEERGGERKGQLLAKHTVSTAANTVSCPGQESSS